MSRVLLLLGSPSSLFRCLHFASLRPAFSLILAICASRLPDQKADFWLWTKHVKLFLRFLFDHRIVNTFEDAWCHWWCLFLRIDVVFLGFVCPHLNCFYWLVDSFYLQEVLWQEEQGNMVWMAKSGLEGRCIFNICTGRQVASGNKLTGNFFGQKILKVLHLERHVYTQSMCILLLT